MSLSKLAAQLEEARKDVETYSRLKSAERRVTELTAAHGVQAAADSAEQDGRRIAARDALLAETEYVRVEALHGPTGPDNLLRTAFRITYGKRVLDSRSWDSPVKAHVVQGFQALPAPVMFYLQEKCPEQIPAEIMALAPGDPDLAFQRYFGARRRGYLS